MQTYQNEGLISKIHEMEQNTKLTSQGTRMLSA